MRRIISLSVIILMIILFNNNIFSQWKKVNQDIVDCYMKYGSFGVFNEILYLGTSNGIYISSDFGNNWELKKNQANIDSVEGICISGRNIFAAYRYRGIFLSQDTFKTWIPRNKGLEKQLDYGATAAKGDTLFLATLVLGILRSTDQGNNWYQMNNGLNSTTVVDVIINGDNVFAATANAFFISYDFGENWHERDNGLKGFEITSIIFDRDIIYAGVYGNGIYYSSDYGLNWIPRNTGLPKGSFVYSMVKKDSIIFAAVHNMNMLVGGFYYSTNLGESWISQNNGINTSLKRATELTILNDDIYLIMDETFNGMIFKIFKANISDLLSVTSVPNVLLTSDNFFAAPAKPNPASDIVRAGIYWDASGYDVEYAEKGIYNVMGNKVGDGKDLLVNNIQPYSAEIVWNCSQVSSGLYFIVLNYNGKTKAIPVLVTR